MENMENNIVDTSQPNYISQFQAPDFDPTENDFFGDEYSDNQDYDNNDNYDSDSDYENENNEDYENNQSNDEQTTGNEVLDKFIEWAGSRDIDVTKLDINPESFDEQQMEEQVAKYYIDKRLGNVDPRITELAENGVSLDEYMEHKNYLKSIATQDPAQLYKATMYDHLLKTEAQLGSISLDENGNPTKEGVDYLVQEVEKRVQKMSQEQIIANGKQIQDYYNQQIEKLPENLIQQQQQKYTQEINRYNNEVEDLTNLMKERFDKSNNLIVDFSGQAEKDEFINYMKDNLLLGQANGQQVVPLLHKLQNDADFLATTMRLLYMHDKGYFTDLKNMERKAAFKKLSVTPVLGKNNKQKQTGGAGKFVDTSDPNYIKKFKR